MSKEAPANSTEIQITDAPRPNAGKKDQENAHSVTIEIPDFENWRKCKIFRVPRNLRNLKEKAYTPQLVSIGPLHHDREELKGMESHKKRYFEEFCERARMSKEDLQSCVQENYGDILARYAGTIHIDPREFEQLILIDACFIFELFIRFSLRKENDYKYLKGDYVLKTPWIMKAIRLDLILLENQLPFFFLENLYKHANVEIKTSDGESKTDDEEPPKCCNVFDLLKAGIESCLNCASNSSSNSKPRIDQQWQEATNNQSEEDEQSEDDDRFRKLTVTFFKGDFVTTADEIKGIKHFTDLVRKSWLPKKKKKERIVNLLYSATKLDKAGLNFVPTASKDSRLASVNITNGPCYKYFPFCRSRRQLELSKLTIDDSTECHMRNVMALEQCLYPRAAFICNYTALMSHIIETPEDIDLLVKNKVIENLLGSSQKAAEFANKLCHEIVQPSFIYSEECKELNSYYESWFYYTRATLKNVYFKDLWTASSTLVGIVVLIFTTYATYKSIVNSL